MLTISFPKEDIDALHGPDGAQCKINGEPVTVRLVDGYLCYRGDGQDNRCKLLMLGDELPNGLVPFYAAEHGKEAEPGFLPPSDETAAELAEALSKYKGGAA